MGKKIDYQQFLKESQEIYNGKYIYNENDYNNKEKLTNKFKIICPIHGEFYENYFNHIKNKRGCPICYQIAQKEKHRKYILFLLKKAKIIHENFYDYSLIDLDKSVKEKNIIICPIHGQFEMTLDNHINGKQKCGKCMLKHYSFEDFKKLSYEKFGKDAFDFSETNYQTWEKNVIIKCTKCGKNINRQPKYHIKSYGCPFCDKDKFKKPEANKWNDFIKNHPTHINLEKASYKNAITPIILYCSKKDKNGNPHGEYEASPVAIYRSKTCACPKCSNRLPRTTEKCIKEMLEKHGDLFSYEKFEYLGKKNSIVTCKKHGDFETNYYRMMTNKHCCPKCNNENNYHEMKLKELLENELNLSMEYNIRPKWLANPISNHNQELDIFIPSLNVAIEYQGRHHFVDIYKDEIKFKHTQELDEEKYKMCKKIGIKLFYFTNDNRNIPTKYFDKIYTNELDLINEIKKLM